MEHSLIFSSASDNGAEGVSSNKDSFSVSLQPPLNIPTDAKYCNIACETAELFNSSPNILTGVNNQIKIKCDSNTGVLTTYTVDLDQALYDLPALDQAIKSSLLNQGAITSPSYAIDLLASESDQKVVIQFNTLNAEVILNTATSMRGILGFNSGVYTNTGTVAGFQTKAQNVADFATVSSYLLHTSLVKDGMRLNNRHSSIIAQIMIDVDVGSQILFRPTNPAKLDASHLIGNKVGRVDIWMTNQKDEGVVLLDPFSCRFVLRHG